MPRASQSQTAVMTTILNTMASKESEYMGGISENHALGKTMAARLAQGGQMEQDLLSMIKGAEGEEDLIPENEIQTFLTEQRERLKALAEKNATKAHDVENFVGSINQLKQNIASSQNGETYQEGTKYESIIKDLMAGRAQKDKSDIQKSTFYTDILDRLGEAVSNDDEEIAVVRSNEMSSAKFKCPITNMWMEDPVKSTVCGHTYSREGIMSHLQKMRNGHCTCPYPGCNNEKLTKDQLEDDLETKRLVNRMKRKEAKEEELRLNSQLDVGMDDDDE